MINTSFQLVLIILTNFTNVACNVTAQGDIRTVGEQKKLLTRDWSKL